MTHDTANHVEAREIGLRLSAAMALRGWNAPRLAEEVGVDRQTIWRYQTGRTSQSFPVMAKAAKALKVKLDFLAYGTGSMEARR